MASAQNPFRVIENAVNRADLRPGERDNVMAHLICMQRRLYKLEEFVTETRGRAFELAEQGTFPRRRPLPDDATRATDIDTMPTMATPIPLIRRR